MALWLRHDLADNDPVARPALALARAVYRPSQPVTAPIGFDEAMQRQRQSVR